MHVYIIEPSNIKIKLHSTRNCKFIIPGSKIILSANKDSVFSVDGGDEGIEIINECSCILEKYYSCTVTITIFFIIF